MWIQKATRWTVVMRTTVTQALGRTIQGVLGRDPVPYALRLGGIGGVTHVTARGASDIQMNRAGRCKSLEWLM